MKQTLRSAASVAALLCAAAALSAAHAEPVTNLEEIFVTATSRPEDRSRIAGTTQVITREAIERSTAKSVTDLLAENAVGFFSEWTPAQTSINIRGAASDGQGRDFRGQVLVLINGRRAGTANLSKLSTADVERIEIVRGPSSVVYGSQNMGGVINLIMKTGRTAAGTLLETSGGSWGLVQGKAQTGGTAGRIDLYAGVAGGQRDDYHVGGSGRRELNTSWERRGATGAVGLQIDPNNRIDVMLRTDGIYDAGFRGSGANYISRDDRYNASFDAMYTGGIPNGRLSWLAHAYVVFDTDVFKWASPVVRSGSNPAIGTSSDYNKRSLDIIGARLQPRVKMWEGHDLLLGYDFETSELRSDRFRVMLPGSALTGQVAPYDNNQSETVNAFYFENAQSFWNERVTVRGGMRQTYGETSFDPTPNLAGQRNRTEGYEALTYSAGATFKAFDWLLLRAGTSSGFRAPTASELAADFTAVGGGRIFGNPNLQPETNEQIEAGATITGPGWKLDAAVFRNIISDRIVTRSRGAGTNTSDYANNPGDIEVKGVEASFDLDILRTFAAPPTDWRWSVFANGYYNFEMVDRGAATTANTDRVQRMYEYEMSVGTRIGQSGDAVRDWSIQFSGLLRGPMWYETEESLLIPQGEPRSDWVHRKSPFWIWNLRGEVELLQGVKLFANVNNLFDVNEHPIFIALDETPCIADRRFQNGGCGTSMAGREFIVGMQARF